MRAALVWLRLPAALTFPRSCRMPEVKAPPAEIAPFVRIAPAQKYLADFCELMDPRYERAAHTNLLSEHLEALARRDIDRLCVMTAPRHSKAYHLSERFTAWTLGRRPSEPIILASYAAEVAEQNSRRARALVQDERFPFPGVKVSGDSAAVNAGARRRAAW